MTLSDAEALDLLTSPKNLTAKAEALAWQNRVRFHGLTVRDKTASAYYPTFKRWVFSFLTAVDKQAAFDNYFPFPVPTTKLMADVHDGWMKVFDAVNPHLTIEGAEGVEDKLLGYLDEIGEPDFWPDEAIAALNESHNDLLLIDLDTTGPYLTRLQLDSVLSLTLKKDSTAEHVAYVTTSGQMIVVDDLDYRVYDKEKEGYRLSSTARHGLGYCPARLLWDERVPNHAVASSAPVDEVLSYLDTYAYFHVAYDLFKLIGANPYTWGMKIESDPAPAVSFVKTNPDGTLDAGYYDQCRPQPKAGSTAVGPGDHFELPPGMQTPVAPVGIVEPSTNALNFQAEDRKRLYDELKNYLTGAAGESSLLNKAINEKQVTGNFSSQENTLRYLSRHLSAAREWGILTIGKLLVGNRLKTVSFSFGTEFYLQTETELWDGLTAARTAGAGQSILLEKVQGIQAFRLRSGGNATRSQLLLDLEPLAEQSLTNVQSLVMSGVVEQKKLAVKANFTDLIAQMERELGADITQIGAGVPYPERINRINQFLYSHVKITQPINTAGNPGVRGDDKRPDPNRTNDRQPANGDGRNESRTDTGATGDR